MLSLNNFLDVKQCPLLTVSILYVLIQVTGLKAGTSYVFRVRAQNLVGVGKHSAVLGPILAHTRPGECDCFYVASF